MESKASTKANGFNRGQRVEIRNQHRLAVQGVNLGGSRPLRAGSRVVFKPNRWKRSEKRKANASKSLYQEALDARVDPRGAARGGTRPRASENGLNQAAWPFWGLRRVEKP